MKFVLGKKLEMTQKFQADGTVVPVTTVLVEPCYIAQIKNKEKDGYRALQIGCGVKKKLNKSLQGHLKDLPQVKHLREFRVEENDETEYKKGQKITADVFAVGDKVKVSGDSKGRGFQGVVKKYNFAGAPKTHGTKDQLRHPGSIGATGPAHVFKGTKMPGRMGGKRVTVSNLEIIDIDNDNNLLFIKGAIPGSRNGIIEIVAPGELKVTVEEKKASNGKNDKDSKVQKEQTEEKKAEQKESEEANKVKDSEVKKDEADKQAKEQQEKNEKIEDGQDKSTEKETSEKEVKDTKEQEKKDDN